MEKNNTPEADSNHNEERITNPCGFVTHIILGPGQARSSLIADKQTEIQLSNHQNLNQHPILHEYTKN